MNNEILLVVSLALIFGSTLVAYRIFGKTGLYIMTAISTIVSNIECLILIDAFAMEQTLGNVFFASTFLITDILSENYSEKDANKAVFIGVFSNIFFILISQSWLLYTPSQNDWVMPSINVVFSNTPRMMISSLVVYAASQFLDVKLYHMWWRLTNKKFGDNQKYLWLRNNGSTLLSQLINTILFTLFAFYGTYNLPTLFSIMISSYIIYAVTGLLDTPMVYLARKMKDNDKISE